MGRWRWLVTLTGAAAALVAGVALVIGDSPGPKPAKEPPLPKPGETVGVLGPDGRPIRCEDGTLLKVKVPGGDPPDDALADQTRPPAEPPAPPADGYEGPQAYAEPQVPRCGPNNEVVWVPISSEKE